jgi:hypothetical protein
VLGVNISLKIFFLETIIPTKLIFWRKCLGLASLDFVHRILEFCIFSEQEVEKSEKIVKSLKIFSRSVSARIEQKAIS